MQMLQSDWLSYPVLSALMCNGLGSYLQRCHVSGGTVKNIILERTVEEHSPLLDLINLKLF